MGYRFRLQKLLEIREKERENAEQEFVRLRNVLESSQQELFALQQKQINLGQEMVTLGTNRVGIQQLLDRQNFSKRLGNMIIEQGKKVKQDEEHLNNQQSILAEKIKEEKIMKQMKEKDFEKFIEEEKKREALEMDEIAIQKYFQHD